MPGPQPRHYHPFIFCIVGRGLDRLTAHNERRQPAKLARSCGCLPCRGKHCSLPDFAPLNRGPTLTTPHLRGGRGRRPLQHNPQGFSLRQTSAAAWGQAALHPTLPHSVGRAFARNSFTPPCRGRACPARSLAITTPFILCIVGRGLDPSAGRRGRRPPTTQSAGLLITANVRGGLGAGRPTSHFTTFRGAGLRPQLIHATL